MTTRHKFRRQDREAQHEQDAIRSEQSGQAMNEERRDVDGKEGNGRVELPEPARRSRRSPAWLKECKYKLVPQSLYVLGRSRMRPIGSQV